MTSAQQLDLFSNVLHSYSAEAGRTLSNSDLYRKVVQRAGLPDDVLEERVAIGADGQPHNLLARAIRWQQQTLKHCGILQRVADRRGVWELTEPAGKDLNRIAPKISLVAFSTDLGVAILGSCDHVFAAIDAPIVLALTSSPFPLAKPRAYGNVDQSHYTDFMCTALEPIVKNLVRGGSICLSISNDIFEPGSPARSLYRERLLLALHDRLGLHLADQFVWVNKSKPPGPVQWASINRVHLNVGWEPIYWLTNDPHALRSDNRRVLQQHSERHLRLIEQGGEKRTCAFSDGAYTLREGSYSRPTEGRIPRNVLEFGHACADQRAYKKAAREMGLPAHGAPMPLKLASFLVEFLSRPGDLVVDPFAGSFTTAKAAELLGRRWLATEIVAEYAIGAATRFQQAPGFRQRIAA